MTQTTVNVAPLEDALGVILLFPELHKQSTWRCSTGMCLAGHVATRQGVSWAFDLETDTALRNELDRLGRLADTTQYEAAERQIYPRLIQSWEASLVVSDHPDAFSLLSRIENEDYFEGQANKTKTHREALEAAMTPGVTWETKVEPVAVYVKRLANLDSTSADALFDGDNTVRDLEKGIKALGNGHRIKKSSLDINAGITVL